VEIRLTRLRFDRITNVTNGQTDTRADRIAVAYFTLASCHSYKCPPSVEERRQTKSPLTNECRNDGVMPFGPLRFCPFYRETNYVPARYMPSSFCLFIHLIYTRQLFQNGCNCHQSFPLLRL